MNNLFTLVLIAMTFGQAQSQDATPQESLMLQKITYESDGYHANEWVPFINHYQMSEEEEVTALKVKARALKLSDDLADIEGYLANSGLKGKSRDSFLVGFCAGKFRSDIIYQIALISGRCDTIEKDLSDLITKLKQ